MTFQEAKDQIAREAGYQSWIHLDEFSPPYKYEQALQKLVQLYATEAIKADRDQISNYLMAKSSLPVEIIVDVKLLPINME